MPRRAAKEFTADFVRTAPAGEYSDAACRGLTLRVLAGGLRTFSLRYVTPDASGKGAQRQARLRLGDFPGLTLKAAREAANRARGEAQLAQASQTEDPQTKKRRLRREAKEIRVRTVADLVDDYLAAAEKRNRASTHQLNTQRLKAYVRPADKLGAMAVEDVTAKDVRRIMGAIESAGHPVTANRVRTLIGVLYRHARRNLDMKHLDDPTEGVEALAEEARDRVLTDAELRKIWLALDNPAECPADISPGMALCIQLAAVTLQRIGECAGIDERELDLEQGLWLIPAARAKNKRPHLVPLSTQALAIIQRALKLKGGEKGKGPLFPGKDRDKPITRRAASRAMGRLCKKLKIDDATTHDLRRTGATSITGERIGFPRFVVSAVLGHVGEMGGVTGVYDRNSYLPEKRKALTAWSALLHSIVTKTERASNVVSMEGARA